MTTIQIINILLPLVSLVVTFFITRKIKRMRKHANDQYLLIVKQQTFIMELIKNNPGVLHYRADLSPTEVQQEIIKANRDASNRN